MATHGRSRAGSRGGWGLFNPLEAVVSVVDDAASRVFGRDATAIGNMTVDWIETPTEHVFQADLPGMKKEEIQVLIEEGRTLRISGESRKPVPRRSDTWHCVERYRGKFLRRFQLPENANVEDIKAQVDDGVLTVIVPKLEAPQPRSIKIDTGGAVARDEGARGNQQVTPTTQTRGASGSQQVTPTTDQTKAAAE